MIPCQQYTTCSCGRQVREVEVKPERLPYADLDTTLTLTMFTETPWVHAYGDSYPHPCTSITIWGNNLRPTT